MINDTKYESDETVIVTLTPGNEDTVISTAQTTLTIGANELSSDTPPRITRLRPAPGTVVRDRTPSIGATVTDSETNLSAQSIRLFVDGRSRSFTYDRVTDRVQRVSGVLTRGRHTVRVRALDPEGARTVRSWAFRIGG
jgi:hypothetical protein